MKPEIKYRFKFIIIEVLSLVIADILLFVLQQNSVISWGAFIFSGLSLNLIFLTIIILFNYRNYKITKPTSS
jgi:hypothetical protein